MTKQLWISLVNDLRTRSLIETPPSTLSQYTTAQLIGQTWRRDIPNEQPLLAEEITVLLGRPVSERNLTVCLINGGQQFILASHAALEIWDVIDKQDTRMIVVARTIEDHTLTMAIQHDTTLEILCINVWDWNLAESMLFPHHDILRGIQSAHIVGNIMAIQLYSNSSILLIDWCARTYVALNGFGGHTYQPFNLIPGSLVVVITIIPLNSSTIKRVRLLVYPIATFGSAWQPFSKLNNLTYLSVTQFAPIVLETPNQFNEPIEIPKLLIYESPLQCGTYKIVLYICYLKGGVGDRALIFLCLGRSTYSGYVRDNDCRVWRVWDDAHPDSLANGTKTELFLPQEMHLGLHLSAYSCVVTRVLQAGSVVLSYYL
ncbi:hypothetical protein B0H14DRAFT_2682337 [Mycena olivaceomarginata]|nr:hypothetical protein B0H14DRAFT_2682337 [Mycena olivaceomarginata]